MDRLVCPKTLLDIGWSNKGCAYNAVVSEGVPMGQRR